MSASSSHALPIMPTKADIFTPETKPVLTLEDAERYRAKNNLEAKVVGIFRFEQLQLRIVVDKDSRIPHPFFLYRDFLKQNLVSLVAPRFFGKSDIRIILPNDEEQKNESNLLAYPLTIEKVDEILKISSAKRSSDKKKKLFVIFSKLKALLQTDPTLSQLYSPTAAKIARETALSASARAKRFSASLTTTDSLSSLVKKHKAEIAPTTCEEFKAHSVRQIGSFEFYQFTINVFISMASGSRQPYVLISEFIEQDLVDINWKDSLGDNHSLVTIMTPRKSEDAETVFSESVPAIALTIERVKKIILNNSEESLIHTLFSFFADLIATDPFLEKYFKTKLASSSVVNMSSSVAVTTAPVAIPVTVASGSSSHSTSYSPKLFGAPFVDIKDAKQICKWDFERELSNLTTAEMNFLKNYSQKASSAQTREETILEIYTSLSAELYLSEDECSHTLCKNMLDRLKPVYDSIQLPEPTFFQM